MSRALTPASTPTSPRGTGMTDARGSNGRLDHVGETVRGPDFDARERPDTVAVSTRRSLAEASDAELSQALCDRDGKALEEAFRRHATLVANIARRTAGVYHVDDVVQTVFLTLWAAPERFQPQRGSLAAYLVMLTRGKTIDAVRSDQHRRYREYGSKSGPGPNDHVEAQALAGVTAAHLQMALRALPMNERVAIELAYFGGHSYRAVAAKLGTAEGTTKSRIRTGLRRLEAALQGIGSAEFD